MKLVLRKQKLQIGLLALAICCLLVSTSPAQNTDTSIVLGPLMDNRCPSVMNAEAGLAKADLQDEPRRETNSDGEQLTEDPQYANQGLLGPRTEHRLHSPLSVMVMGKST